MASPEGWVARWACDVAAAQLSPRLQLGDGSKHLMASLKQDLFPIPTRSTLY